MINKITSRDNKLLKTVKSLHKKKGREQTGLYFAEGVRLVDEALLHIPDAIEYLLVSEEFADKNKNKTQTEIAGIFGVSQVQISRLEKKILQRLRSQLA